MGLLLHLQTSIGKPRAQDRSFLAHSFHIRKGRMQLPACNGALIYEYSHRQVPFSLSDLEAKWAEFHSNMPRTVPLGLVPEYWSSRIEMLCVDVLSSQVVLQETQDADLVSSALTTKKQQRNKNARMNTHTDIEHQCVRSLSERCFHRKD